MKILKAAISIVFLCLIPMQLVQAAIALVVADFEDIIFVGSSGSAPQVESADFLFTQTNATEDEIIIMVDVDAACGPDTCVDSNTSQWMSVYNEDQAGPFEVRIEDSQGDAFDLSSFELATLLQLVPEAGSGIVVNGYPDDGGEVLTREILFDDNPNNFQLVEFDNQWSKLSHVIIRAEQDFPAFDNFNFMFTSPPPVAPIGSLEIPPEGGEMSGISIVSGWHCSASKIEVAFNGGDLIEVASGTTRGDTADVCAGNTDTGYSLLWAYSLLGAGEHTAVVYADGVEFDSATFTVTLINGEDFVVGASGSYLIRNFPVPGNDVVVRWSEASQGFVIVDSTN